MVVSNLDYNKKLYSEGKKPALMVLYLRRSKHHEDRLIISANYVLSISVHLD